MNRENRQREPKALSRCGCQARCQVHVEENSGRWYFKYFNDIHNHTFMGDKHTGMLPAHRKISEFDRFQADNMRKVGIRTPHIYGWLASQAGGYENLQFMKRDLYNVQYTPSKTFFSDAKAALDYLDDMRSSDELMFCRHTVDGEGRLQHLFWCDGVGRSDYSVFGDVLAFDATYRKNKYMCPLVVFSGVNHHNMSTVFASAIVGNETEETYVWLLEQFLEAMDGKTPVSVITDGDAAMRNAIRRVFPNAHHRLCAWHLIRNATSNVKNPNFVSKFKQCMLGDVDIVEFNRLWDKLVTDFGLEQNTWVLDLYQKRRMWATAYIRGNFFAGFRTTSRCEGLHSEFGKYVNCKNNLVDFLQHYFRWMDYMRYREVEADYMTLHGEPVLKTQFEDLERSAALLYTREVFKLFRGMLQRACTCRVDDVTKDGSDFIFIVSRYRREGCEWRVTFFQSSLEFKYSCMRFESLGIPCEHMIYVMIKLNIVNLPECVVLKRWTKGAKDSVGVLNPSRDPSLWCQYVALVENCKNMAKEAYECGRVEEMRKTIESVRSQREYFKAIRLGQEPPPNLGPPPNVVPDVDGRVKNPNRIRTKGCGGASTSSQAKGKKTQRRTITCSVCGGKGHNRQSCAVQREVDLMGATQFGSNSFYDGDFGEVDDEDEYANIDMVSNLDYFIQKVYPVYV